MKPLMLALAFLFASAPVVAQDEAPTPTLRLKDTCRILQFFGIGDHLFVVIATANPDGSRNIDVVDMVTGDIVLTIVEGGKPAGKMPVKR